MWQEKETQGFIEIEQDYARLLKNSEGTIWTSETVLPENDIWTALSKAVPNFFSPKTKLNFICSYGGDTTVIDFPSNSTNKDIEDNLQINRRNYFNEFEEICFKLQNSYPNKEEQKKDVAVSYVFLNKNSAIVARGDRNGKQDLTQLSIGISKPGVRLINNSLYAWDKYGRLYEVVDGKLKVIPNTSGRVWQVVSEGNNPVVLTTSLKANKLIYNVSNQSYTAKQASNSSFYQIASLEGDFSAGITQNNDLISLEGSSIFNNEVEDVAVSSKHGLFLVAKNDGTKGYDLWGWGKNERGEIVSTEKDSAGNDRLTEYTTPVKVSCSLKSPTGATSGSVSPMNDYKTIKEYFSGTYNYPPNNSGSACDITNPYRAGEVERHLGSNIDRCTCALCLDVWDLHRQNTNLYTTLKISEPQNITNLQLMLDRDGCSSIMHNLPEEKTGNKIQKQVRKSRQVPYTDWWGRTRYRTEYYYEWEWVDETVPTLYTKCTLTKLDSNGNATNQGVSFIAKNAIKTNESIVTPLGTVYSLDFDNFLQTAYDRSGKNIISSNGYEIQNGNYRIKWEYSKNLGSTYSEFAQDALFWGIDPKAISEEELKRKKAGSSYGGGGYYGGSTQLSLTQDQLFGSIFRLNSNMFNLRGGIEYDDEVPTYYALAAGENFSLAIILTKTDIDSGNRENYRIIGWGDNKYNQLGIGVASNSVKMTILPIQPDIVKSYRDMKAGQYHTLFLTNTGKVYSWGGGVAKEDPHPIEGLSDIVYISAGNDYSSAIDKAGNIYSWNVNNETSLTKIAGGEAFSQ